VGGGVGVSVHGKFRVATEKTGTFDLLFISSVFAMPESAIGFFPDVGGSLFLARLDLKYGSLGKYLGLTGAQLRGKDTVSGGVATHYVLSEKLPALEHELVSLENTSEENVKAVLDKFAEEVPSIFSIRITIRIP
jgi:enoyl-CoA hydratase/carnithine racemase